jgi:4'-phosphopantetheinyl transferase
LFSIEHSAPGTQIMVEIYIIQLLPLEEFEQVRDQLLGLLPPEARVRFARLSRGADVHRSLLGELLARYLISSKFNITSKEIEFKIGPNGKPEMAGNDTIHFNISHSGQWVACAISGFPVGVDVERLRPVRPGLAERFFTTDEVDTLKALPDEERTERFIELWTLKESFLKAIGRGLTRNLNSFTIEPDGRLFRITGDDSSNDYHLKLFEIDPGYRLSVCATTTDFCESIRKIEVDQLLNELINQD